MDALGVQRNWTVRLGLQQHGGVTMGHHNHRLSQEVTPAQETRLSSPHGQIRSLNPHPYFSINKVNAFPFLGFRFKFSIERLSSDFVA